MIFITIHNFLRYLTIHNCWRKFYIEGSKAELEKFSHQTYRVNISIELALQTFEKS